MNTYTDVTYEVLDPVTEESFVTGDHYVALFHYEKNYTVYETHTTITVQSSSAHTRLQVTSCWKDKD